MLASGEPAAGTTLATVLEPVAGQAVATAIVASVLARVGLGERPDGPWVALDGRFVVGPLAGRGAKHVAEHVGAAAREARRARRIAELRERVADLDARIAAHDADVVAVDRRRRTLETELRAVPPADALWSARDAVRIASGIETDADRAHGGTLAELRSASDT